MFLKERDTGHLVQVINMAELINPFERQTQIQYQQGENLQDPEYIHKSGLTFPSGESLPKCWTDSHYRDHELRRY